ncbi:MAG: hypothetical protein AB1568_07300 [Thermodesulfobacteriota bacterium]
MTERESAMGHEGKPQVHLEISSGFFRIPTEHLVYNLTVIGGEGIRVVEKIVERELAATAQPAAASGTAPDPFFAELTELLLRRSGAALRTLAAESSREKAEAGGNLQAELEKARAELSAVGRMDRVADREQVAGALSPVITELVARLQEAAVMLGGAQAVPETPADAAAPPSARRRYLFDLDVVFQTLYELCTNEQVKGHISKARQNRDSFFDLPVFLDSMTAKLAGMEPDGDNFFNVPMADVLQALADSCREKPIVNLLKKMDASQADIFLDGFLPLEAPPTEEVAVEAGPADLPPPPPATPPPAMAADELQRLLAEIQNGLNELAGRVEEIAMADSCPAPPLDVSAIEACLDRAAAAATPRPAGIAGTMLAPLRTLCAVLLAGKHALTQHATTAGTAEGLFAAGEKLAARETAAAADGASLVSLLDGAGI